MNLTAVQLNASLFGTISINQSIKQSLVLFKIGNCVYEHTMTEGRHVHAVMFKCMSVSTFICNGIRFKFKGPLLNLD